MPGLIDIWLCLSSVWFRLSLWFLSEDLDTTAMLCRIQEAIYAQVNKYLVILWNDCLIPLCKLLQYVWSTGLFLCIQTTPHRSLQTSMSEVFLTLRFSPLLEHLISIQYIYDDSNRITRKIIVYIKSIDLQKFLPSTHRFHHKTRPAAPGKFTSIYCTIHSMLYYTTLHYPSYPFLSYPKLQALLISYEMQSLFLQDQAWGNSLDISIMTLRATANMSICRYNSPDQAKQIESSTSRQVSDTTLSNLKLSSHFYPIPCISVVRLVWGAAMVILWLSIISFVDCFSRSSCLTPTLAANAVQSCCLQLTPTLFS